MSKIKLMAKQEAKGKLMAMSKLEGMRSELLRPVDHYGSRLFFKESSSSGNLAQF